MDVRLEVLVNRLQMCLKGWLIARLSEGATLSYHQPQEQHNDEQHQFSL
jgi:hypothetical protein